jgi:hypothetical protein
MASLAHSFVTGSAAEGHHFHYAVDDGPRLDELVELFQMSAPSDDVVHSMVLSMGAYVEEVLVRNASGQWRVEMQAPAIRLPGDLDCFPLNKVAKRITVGPEHSIGGKADVDHPEGCDPGRTAYAGHPGVRQKPMGGEPVVVGARAEGARRA